VVRAGKQISNQPQRDTEPLELGILDAMIGRAEVACERYRRNAERKGIPPDWIERRRRTLQTMEAVLARLQFKREAVASKGLLAGAKRAAVAAPRCDDSDQATSI
jgi:hypothetical protein